VNLSPEETRLRDKRIAELTREGYSGTQIARRVGVTHRTVQRARVRTGVAQPFCGIPLTPEEIRLAESLLDDGASYCEVGRTLGRSMETIRRRFRGRSMWAPGSGVEYRKLMVALNAIVPPTDWEVAL
jgi:IS30 family transposase